MLTINVVLLMVTVAFQAPAQDKITSKEEEQIRQLLEQDEDYDEKELARLGAFTPAAFPLYCRILDDPKEHRWIVGRTLYTLSIIKADRGQFVDRAVAKLTSPHISLRRGAVELLAQIGSPRDATPVVALLSDKEWTISISAAKTLAAIGDERTLVALDIWLNSGSYQDHKVVREHVMKSRDELKERLEKEKKQKPPEK